MSDDNCIKMICENENDYVEFLNFLLKNSNNNYENLSIIEKINLLRGVTKENENIDDNKISYYQCRFCKSKFGKTFTSQIRSADEGSNTVFHCAQCNRMNIF